jgi:hypothetical protein
MAQGGSGRTGGKARPAGRGSAGGRNSSSNRGGSTGRSGSTGGTGRAGGPGRGGKSPKQTSVAAQRAIKGARGRSGNLLRVGVPVLVVAIVAAVVVFGVLNANKNAAANVPATGDTSTAILASTAGEASGDAVDGVQSNTSEQVLFHVHAHLAMYVNGKPKLLPYGVGIVPPYQLQQTADGPFVAGGAKFYWLHTHDETGVIHIESPVQRTFTLGNFFDEWHQPLSATQVGPAKGKVTAFVGGKKFTGNPRNIPLGAHVEVQLDVGTVVPFANYTFPQGL